MTFETEEQFDSVCRYGRLKGINLFFFCNFGFVCNCLSSGTTNIRHRLRKNSDYFVILKSPEPDELVWAYQGRSNWLNNFLRIVSFVLMYSTCIITAFLILVFKEASRDIKEVSPALSLLFSVMIIGLNLLTVSLASIMAKSIQRPATNSELTNTVVWRAALIMFINSAIILYIFSQGSTDEDQGKREFWDEKGAPSDLFMMVVTSFGDAATEYASLGYYWQLSKRWRFSKDPKASKLTQREANALFEGQSFSIEARGAKYLYRTCLMFFVLRGFPIVAALHAMCLLVFIYNDRLWLLKFCKMPRRYSVEMIYDFIRFFDLILFFYGVAHVNCS